MAAMVRILYVFPGSTWMSSGAHWPSSWASAGDGSLFASILLPLTSTAIASPDQTNGFASRPSMTAESVLLKYSVTMIMRSSSYSYGGASQSSTIKGPTADTAWKPTCEW